MQFEIPLNPPFPKGETQWYSFPKGGDTVVLLFQWGRTGGTPFPMGGELEVVFFQRGRIGGTSFSKREACRYPYFKVWLLSVP